MPFGRKTEVEPLKSEETALFDKREQLAKLEAVLLDGEEVLACLDMGAVRASSA